MGGNNLVWGIKNISGGTPVELIDSHFAKQDTPYNRRCIVDLYQNFGLSEKDREYAFTNPLAIQSDNFVDMSCINAKWLFHVQDRGE